MDALVTGLTLAGAFAGAAAGAGYSAMSKAWLFGAMIDRKMRYRQSPPFATCTAFGAAAGAFMLALVGTSIEVGPERLLQSELDYAKDFVPTVFQSPIPRSSLDRDFFFFNYTQKKNTFRRGQELYRVSGRRQETEKRMSVHPGPRPPDQVFSPPRSGMKGCTIRPRQRMVSART